MRNLLFAGCGAFALCAGAANAQLLDTTAVADQFNAGSRGGGGRAIVSGQAYPTSATIAPGAGVTGSITYTNTFGDNASESPVLDATTAQTHPDRAALTIAAVTANTRPGATSPTTAVFVGDDGGYNSLAFGDTNSRNYFAQVDAFCPDLSAVPGANTGSLFTRFGLAVRNFYLDEPAVDGPGIVSHTTGNYALLYESSIRTVYAAKIVQQSAGFDTRNTRFAALDDASSTVPTVLIVGKVQFASGSNAWHTLRINASSNQITFLVDGTQIGQLANDSSNPKGAAVLTYRAGSGAFDNNAATDTQGRFDNMSAGPFAPQTGVADWTLY